MNSSVKKRFLLFILLVVYFVIAYAVLNYYGISCAFLEFLGIPCPGCGMTRALLSVLKLDFIQAARYNVMIFFMPYLFVYVFFDLKGRKHNIVLSLIAVLAVLNWIIKIFFM